jgi:hypothetical protein
VLRVWRRVENLESRFTEQRGRLSSYKARDLPFVRHIRELRYSEVRTIEDFFVKSPEILPGRQLKLSKHNIVGSDPSANEALICPPFISQSVLRRRRVERTVHVEKKAAWLFRQARSHHSARPRARL